MLNFIRKIRIAKMLHISIIALVATSCGMEEPPSMNSKASDLGSDNYFITLDEALANADAEFTAVYGNITRSGRKMKKLEMFRFKTRADNEDLNGYYFVNYDNGFAILSADRRRPNVLAISNEGSLSLKDTLSNAGIDWYINTALPNFKFGPGFGHLPDTLLKPFDPPLPDVVTFFFETTYKRSYGILSSRIPL